MQSELTLVFPNLYVGSEGGAVDSWLSVSSVEAALRDTAEPAPDEAYYLLGVPAGMLLSGYILGPAIRLVAGFLAASGPVAVCCATGVSWGPSVAAAGMALYSGCDMGEALTCVRDEWPQADPLPEVFERVSAVLAGVRAGLRAGLKG